MAFFKTFENLIGTAALKAFIAQTLRNPQQAVEFTKIG